MMIQKNISVSLKRSEVKAGDVIDDKRLNLYIYIYIMI